VFDTALTASEVAIASVPEPSTWLTAALLILATAIVRQRRSAGTLERIA
jgi:hypothetical protein